jgi:hypothetical protein
MTKRLDQPMEAVTCGTGFIAEMHVIELRGYSLNYAAHVRIGCINLAEIPDLSVSSRFGNSNRILQFGNIDSDKSFSIICHGSSSCDEDRLGLSEQPSEDQCRASHLRREDGHTVLPFSLGLCRFNFMLMPCGIDVSRAERSSGAFAAIVPNSSPPNTRTWVLDFPVDFLATVGSNSMV